MAHELHRYFLRSTIGVIFLTLPITSLAAMGDMTLSAPMLDSTVYIQTRAKFAGAVSSIVFRGKQFIDSFDHGRELQSASSFDGYGECYNPTEAGSRADGMRDMSSSVLKAARKNGNQIWTTTDMAFWLSPGDPYPQGCGTQKSIKQAVNTTIVSGHLLKKCITVGLPGFPNVIEHKVTFYVPTNFTSATFEASTGYVPKEFSHSLYYDPKHRIEIDTGTRQGEQAFPVILSTPDNLYAIAVYSPQLPQKAWPNVGYGRFSFPNVNKWNCVFREHDLIPKPYIYQCLIVLGTLNEVEETLNRLDETYGNTTP